MRLPLSSICACNLTQEHIRLPWRWPHQDRACFGFLRLKPFPFQQLSHVPSCLYFVIPSNCSISTNFSFRARWPHFWHGQAQTIKPDQTSDDCPEKGGSVVVRTKGSKNLPKRLDLRKLSYCWKMLKKFFSNSFFFQEAEWTQWSDFETVQIYFVAIFSFQTESFYFLLKHWFTKKSIVLIRVFQQFQRRWAVNASLSRKIL